MSFTNIQQIWNQIPTSKDAATNVHSYLSTAVYVVDTIWPYITIIILIFLYVIYLSFKSDGIMYWDERHPIKAILKEHHYLQVIIFSILLCFTIVCSYMTSQTLIKRDYYKNYVKTEQNTTLDAHLLTSNSKQLSTVYNLAPDSVLFSSPKSIVIYHETNTIQKHPIIKLTKQKVTVYDTTGSQYLKLLNRAQQIAGKNTIKMPLFTTDNRGNLKLRFMVNSKTYNLAFKEQKIIEVILN